MRITKTAVGKRGTSRTEGRRGAFRIPMLGVSGFAGFMLVAACGAAESPAKAQATPIKTTGVTHVIDIIEFRFAPDSLKVRSGDRITWRNRDVVPHTATDVGKSWNSGNLNTDQEWSMTAGAAGSFSYVCSYHPSMKGRIEIVQ